MSQHQVVESSSVIIHGFQIKFKGPTSLPAAPPPWRFSDHHGFTTPPLILREPVLSPLLHHRTQFIWAPRWRLIEPMLDASLAHARCFVLSNSTSPPNALASQYFGLFTNSTVPVVAPLLAVEFDIGRNPEFNDPDGNHIGIDLNNIESATTQSTGYYNSTGGFVPIQMQTGQNVRTWIEFDNINFEINVTVAPANLSWPSLLKKVGAWPTRMYSKLGTYLLRGSQDSSSNVKCIDEREIG